MIIQWERQVLNNLKLNNILSTGCFNTERLKYRPALESDVTWVVSMILQPYVHRYWRIKPPKNVSEVQINSLIQFLKTQQQLNRIENNHNQYIIIVEDVNGTKIGEMSLEHPKDSNFNGIYDYVTVGYWVCWEYQCKGYATEMLSGLTKLLLKNGITQHIILEVYKDNIKSIRVIEKTNYRMLDINEDIIRFIA